jgi:hypothetical protein
MIIFEHLLSALKDVDTAAKSLTSQSVDIVKAAEITTEALEKAVITSRNTLEALRPSVAFPKHGDILPSMSIAGMVRVIETNWLHIQLNALLPHCRFQTPAYLTDTITRLLDTFAASGGVIPYHERALLVIDEHCDTHNRTVYDQDNKGWKAVSHALKGCVFPDDDQFSLGIVLVSAQSEKPQCNIFVIGAEDANMYFEMRSAGTLYW